MYAPQYRPGPGNIQAIFPWVIVNDETGGMATQHLRTARFGTERQAQAFADHRNDQPAIRARWALEDFYADALADAMDAPEVAA